MKKLKNIGIAALAGVLLITVLVGAMTKSDEKIVPGPAEVKLPETKYVDRYIEKEITADIIKDGLRDMGFLITQEYYFEQVLDYYSVKKMPILNVKLGFTETSYIVGYEGVLEAGINFANVTVDKNDAEKTLTIHMPEAEIKAIDVDYDSFKVYEEKTGWRNPLSVQDFNASLKELEKNATEKAMERGILEKATENGEKVISQFVTGLLGKSEYRIIFS